MICSNCKAEIKNDSNFCYSCGNKIDMITTIDEKGDKNWNKKQKARRRGLIFLIGLIFFVGIGTGVGVLYTKFVVNDPKAKAKTANEDMINPSKNTTYENNDSKTTTNSKNDAKVTHKALSQISDAEALALVKKIINDDTVKISEISFSSALDADKYYKFAMTNDDSEWDFNYWVNKKTGVVCTYSSDGTLEIYKQTNGNPTDDTSTVTNNTGTTEDKKNSTPENKKTTPIASENTSSENTDLGNWEWTSNRSITSADLSKVNKSDLRIMRNEIYARHGWIFTDKTLQTYFNSQGWYKPAGEVTDKDKIDNSIYSAMSTLEKQNAQFIMDYEKKLNKD